MVPCLMLTSSLANQTTIFHFMWGSGKIGYGGIPDFGDLLICTEQLYKLVNMVLAAVLVSFHLFAAYTSIFSTLSLSGF